MVVTTTEVAVHCPECKSINIILDREQGEYVCGDCGLVINTIVVNGKPCVYHDDTYLERRQHGPANLQTIHNKGLPTTIRLERDGQGRNISKEKKGQILRMSKLQRQLNSKNGIERTLLQGLSYLKRFCDALQLPYGARGQAAVIFRKAAYRNIIRGRSISGVAAGCVYLACREYGCARSYGEIAKACEVKKKDLTRICRLLMEHLEFTPPSTTTYAYLSKYASELHVNGEPIATAIQLLKRLATKKARFGKDPRGLAASSLYIACRQNNAPITQADVAKVSGLTEVTVRNRYKDITMVLGLEVPKPC